MKYKILTIFLIGMICITACSSKLDVEKPGVLNNIYSSLQKLDENDPKEVNKDKYEMIEGKIKKINVRGGKRSLLIEDEKGMEYIFHINENTIIMTFDKLKIGQNVDIIFNGILTRSIPPQGTAMIVNGLKV